MNWFPLRESDGFSAYFDRMLGRNSVSTKSNSQMVSVAVWMPSVELCETEAAYLIKGEIPGVKKEDLKITLQDGMLTIQHVCRQKNEERDNNFYRNERPCGSFGRSFNVPEGVNESAVETQFNDGRFKVILPKSART